MNETKEGFRNDKGKLTISKDDLAAKIVEIAEQELAAWRPAGGAITVDKPAGLALVNGYLVYLFATAGMRQGAWRSGSRRETFDPVKHPWSALFVCYCVTKAFVALGGRDDGDVAFRRRVPLTPSPELWQCCIRAHEARWKLRTARARYWLYRAGLPLEKGDIVIKDRRTRRSGESGQSFGELKTKPNAPLHADIVVGVDADQARLIGGGHAGSVKEVLYPLDGERRIDPTKSSEGAAAAARAFAVLRLQPEVRLDTDSGRRHKGIVKLPHIDDTPVLPGAMGCESGEDVLFPSMERLCVADDRHKALWADEKAEHWDAFAKSPATKELNLELAPLLEVDEKLAVRLSKDITVADFLHNKRDKFARIDPGLIELLQKLQDELNKPVRIASGYRSWQGNKDHYEKLRRLGKTDRKKPTMSAHTRGIAADVGVTGMSGLELAKKVIDVFEDGIGGLGIGMEANLVHVDIRPKRYFYPYGEANRSKSNELERYYAKRKPTWKPKPPGR